LPSVADELKSAYLLTGSDRPKIDRALHRLRARFGEDAVERLHAHDTTGDDAVAACNAMGLFSTGGRLVLVDEVERWKAADAKAIAAYLAAPAPDTVLALVGHELRKDSPLAKACAKAGSVLVYEVTKKDLPKWIADQFALHGVKASAEAGRALLEAIGDNFQELASEIDKLALWAGADEITENEVEVLVAARAETPPWVLTDAWGKREVGAVLAACESILERSTPRSREVHGLVGRLAGHIRRVQACQNLDAEGVRARDAAPKLKMHPFAAQKAFDQARNYSTEELREAVVRLAALDLALKGGSRLPAELELQRTLGGPSPRPSRPRRAEGRRRAGRPATSCGRPCWRAARPWRRRGRPSGRARDARPRSSRHRRPRRRPRGASSASSPSTGSGGSRSAGGSRFRRAFSVAGYSAWREKARSAGARMVAKAGWLIGDSGTAGWWPRRGASRHARQQHVRLGTCCCRSRHAAWS
jgi:DNA polymerase III subunit delta